MSFGFSVGDFVLLTQLAWTTFQNACQATGAHHELSQQVASLHVVLQRLERERSTPGSLLNQTGDDRQKELATLLRGCRRLLKRLTKVLQKYNELPKEKKSSTKLWQKFRFGNGEMQDLGKMRLELATHTNAITMFFNLLSLGSQGKVESYLDNQGEDIRELRRSVNWITASLQARATEGSVLTSYADDDKATWKQFRRELINQGFSSSILRIHEKSIKDYVLELGRRGALDELNHDPASSSTPREMPPAGSMVERTSTVVEEHISSSEEDADEENVVEDNSDEDSSSDDAPSDDSPSILIENLTPHGSRSLFQKSSESLAKRSIPQDEIFWNGLDVIFELDPYKQIISATIPIIENITFPSENIWYPVSTIISTALFRLGCHDNPDDYCLYSISKDEERYLHKSERPLYSFQRYPNEDLNPIFSLRKSSTVSHLGRLPSKTLTSHKGKLRRILISHNSQIGVTRVSAEGRATIADAKRFNVQAIFHSSCWQPNLYPIPWRSRFGVEVSLCMVHWDPRQEPIRLFGCLFDLISLCNYIYDSACIYEKLQFSRRNGWQAASRSAESRADELRDTLVLLHRWLVRLQRELPYIVGTEDRGVVERLMARGKDILVEFRKIVTVAQEAVLFTKKDRFVAELQKRYDLLPPETFWEQIIIPQWEIEPVEAMRIRAQVDFVRYMLIDPAARLENLFIRPAKKWLRDRAVQSQSILRQAMADRSRIPSSAEHSAQALVLSTRGSSLSQTLRRLEHEARRRRGALEREYAVASEELDAANDALDAFPRNRPRFGRNRRSDSDFRASHHEVCARVQVAKQSLDMVRRKGEQFEISWVAFRDYLIHGRKPLGVI